MIRPKKTNKSGPGDLFRARLDQIIDMGHELVRLGACGCARMTLRDEARRVGMAAIVENPAADRNYVYL